MKNTLFGVDMLHTRWGDGPQCRTLPPFASPGVRVITRIRYQMAMAPTFMDLMRSASPGQQRAILDAQIKAIQEGEEHG